MNSDPNMSVQAQVRPGRAQDLYYISSEESRRQAFPTVQNTRYFQTLTNTGSGSSTVTLPANNGVQQFVLVLGWNANTVAAGSGLGLSRGWGYLGAVRQVSIRYGGSSTFFFTGPQLLERCLRQSPNGTFADSILQLGGNAVLVDNDWTKDQYAYVLINLPHTCASPEGETTTVLPSDLLTQQITLTVELNPPSSYFSVNPSVSPAVAPPALFNTAYVQVQQVILDNQGDALARRVDMDTSMYALPLPSFDQQEVVIPLNGLGNTLNDIPITATGFRSGQVRSIQMWLTRASDTSGGTKNLTKWYPYKKIEMLYAGEVFQRFDDYSSQMWNLINGRLATVANTVELTAQAGPATGFTASAGQLYWHELDFAQTHIEESTTNVLVNGKSITNGILNLNIKVPSAQTDWVVHILYVYNSTLLFSKGKSTRCGSPAFVNLEKRIGLCPLVN
jgi:hypothetical protein